MKIKKRYFIPLALIILAAITAVVAFFWYNENTKPVSADKNTVEFVVPKGRSAVQIANLLYENKLIRSPLAFKIYVQLNGKSQSIQAGEFKLSPSQNLREIVNDLMKGPLELWVTIPEGLRREEVVERYVKSLEMTEAQADQFRNEFLLETKDKEGQLFPDTYLFPRDVSAAKVISVMNNTFNKKIDEIGAKNSPDLTVEAIVVLASIIERETKTDAERPIVAGILNNRLEIGMALQTDATVQYAVASAKCRAQSAKCENWWPVLTRDDLQVESPFNTYKYNGLPPAPIANPGLSSLKAAFQPTESEYLYYIHDPDGNIHYAKTLPEHNENVRKYLGK